MPENFKDILTVLSKRYEDRVPPDVLRVARAIAGDHSENIVTRLHPVEYDCNCRSAIFPDMAPLWWHYVDNAVRVLDHDHCS